MGSVEAARRVNELKVGEIMIPLDRYPMVRTSTTLREAIRVMKESHLEVAERRSLPRVLLVLDERDRLIGLVRRRDIMRGLEPKFLVMEPLEYRKKLFDVASDPNLTEVSHEQLAKGVREQAERTVAKVMRPVVAIINFDDHLIKAVYEMVTHGLSLLPVVQHCKPVGVLRSVEVFHELVTLLD
ncbi:MAG: CBS domain-containing protein [Deltaproteobacteria bacterium]|jgi:predicted transcriptional regulator|nr:CBS domain-containing protein [Deltaproteobacteria bacterium]MBW2537354.1 CBS domain-containing protein [Deltaproteobacteria bacterium]